MINFSLKSFTELTLEELYDAMVLRQEVFAVEQDCVYLDADNKDQDAWHLLGKNEKGALVAYLRILPKGLSYKQYPSIGRVVTSAKVRKQGAGKALLAAAIQEANTLFPGMDIKISAQTYLLRFYKSFGFEPTGEEYLEDGIPHMAMIRSTGV